MLSYSLRDLARNPMQLAILLSLIHTRGASLPDKRTALYDSYVELFFSTEGYRGVKVNNPKNLSGFYLPNSQLFFGATLLGSGPAIILAPERVSGPTVGNGAVFRPAFNQPFVQFPFVGGSAGTFGLAQPNPAGTSGCPAQFPCIFTLGAPSRSVTVAGRPSSRTPSGHRRSSPGSGTQPSRWTNQSWVKRPERASSSSERREGQKHRRVSLP